MNIFEELIDELKEENLLETTVIGKNRYPAFADNHISGNVIEAQTALENHESARVVIDDIQAPTTDDFSIVTEEQVEKSSSTAADNRSYPPYPPVNINKPADKAAYYRERAVLEVSSLQMVEHVLSGIEREQMKVLPKAYNDLEVKKTLHSFLQVSSEINSAEHAQAEFQLMQETESWYSSLSHRDKHISAAHLRRYCENARPALSAQALTSLARFYRNSPYSESVRNKFDLIITRLFSKDVENDQRILVFKRDEFITKLTELYEEWSSISLYSTDEEDSETLLAAFKFEDFMAEADNAESFDELIRNDFFNRLRIFKENTNEQFFAPLVTATAIECNIRIGNRFVELVKIEREKGEAEKLENKYGFLHDQVISDSTGKTLQLVALLNDKKDLTGMVKEKKVETAKPIQIGKPKETVAKTNEPKAAEIFTTYFKKQNREAFPAKKRMMVLAAFALLAFSGLYLWVNLTSMDNSAAADTRVHLENSSLKEFVREAQINNDTFTGIVQPSWNNLSREKKEQILKKILSIAGDKGFKNVQLQDGTNKTVGLAKPDKIEIY